MGNLLSDAQVCEGIDVLRDESVYERCDRHPLHTFISMPRRPTSLFLFHVGAARLQGPAVSGPVRIRAQHLQLHRNLAQVIKRP